MGSKSGGESSTKIDPRLMKLYEKNYERAEGIADQPYQGYDGDQLAPFTGGQQQALGGIQEQALRGGQVGGQGMDMLSRMLAGEGQADLEGQMNPYTDLVTNRALSDLERQRGMATDTIGDQAAAASAFGGSRHGVAEALTNEGFARQGGNIFADLQQANFQNAQNRVDYLSGTGIEAGRQALTDGLQGGTIEQGQDQAGLDIAYQNFLEERDYPLRQLEILQSGLSQVPVGTSTSQPGGSRAGGALSGAAAGAAVGSAFPGYGTAIGAGVGGLIGLLG